MLRVYVAGPYRCKGKCGVDLQHMRRGLRMGVKVLLAGYAPFVPWFDFHHTFMLREDEGEEITVQMYQDFSMEWLRVTDVVLIMPGWEDSEGTKAEIKEAEELGIPVVYSFEELLERFPVE